MAMPASGKATDSCAKASGSGSNSIYNNVCPQTGELTALPYIVVSRAGVELAVSPNFIRQVSEGSVALTRNPSGWNDGIARDSVRSFFQVFSLDAREGRCLGASFSLLSFPIQKVSHRTRRTNIFRISCHEYTSDICMYAAYHSDL